MKQSPLLTILLSVLLVSCTGTFTNAQSGEPNFLVTTKNQDDQVDIQGKGNRTQIDIYSPTGIGFATFELRSGKMPETILLRLHLQGLEELRLVSAGDQIAASIPSSDPLHSEQRIISSETESPLLPGAPLWINLEIVSNGEKQIPLKQGYFEVTLPQQFLQNAGTTFEVHWIDFYR